jgi:uncharacterized membrane protein
MNASASVLLLSEKLFAPSIQIVGADESRFVGSLLDIATGIFCIVLFAITLSAWSHRGRQRSLLVVSIAFLVFLFRQIVEFLPLDDVYSQLARSILDFLTLAIFFIGLVLIGPRRKPELKDLR